MSRKREADIAEEPEVGATPEEPDAAGDEQETASAGEADQTAAGPESELAQELAAWRDRALRTAAEMENFRRRAALEAENTRKYANEGLLLDLIPVIDNFQRAVEAAEKTPNFDALKSGVDLIHRQLNDVLKKVGLEQIEAVGQPFDPNFHQAVMQVEPEDGQEPHQVVEELRPGYKLNDRVLRPTMVKVTSG